MKSFVHHRAINKAGEEVCGDSFRTYAGGDRCFFVLSDGLGSGIKASIFSNLTVRIITAMAAADIPLSEIVRTVSRTLPLCRERGIAYATFTMADVSSDGFCELVSYDNPDPILVRGGKVFVPEWEERTIQDKKVKVASLQLDQGDAIFQVSDGVVYAGLGREMNFGWQWSNVAQFVADAFAETKSVEETVDRLLARVAELYGGEPGDDATVIGSEIRQIRSISLFTGPPMDRADDRKVVEAFLAAPGRKVICGGTTANIVARVTGRFAEVDISSARKDVPPMGIMEGIDLVTEGVLTISRAVQLLKEANLDERNIPEDRNGATELARALLGADHVKLFLGLRVDPLYQNPLLPLSISLRKYLGQELIALLRDAGKSVEIEYH
ncbi:MAG: SpoIIE family protein phosphatase [Candidatus Polarisedimenticolia bacterium]